MGEQLSMPVVPTSEVIAVILFIITDPAISLEVRS